MVVLEEILKSNLQDLSRSHASTALKAKQLVQLIQLNAHVLLVRYMTIFYKNVYVQDKTRDRAREPFHSAALNAHPKQLLIQETQLDAFAQKVRSMTQRLKNVSALVVKFSILVNKNAIAH